MNTSVSSSLKLDGAGQLRQLHQLGELGVDREVGGRTCIALTDDEHAGRDLVVRWMHELGLDVRVDHHGNIFRTLHSDSDDGSQRPLITGSHIDTVKNAGAHIELGPVLEAEKIRIGVVESLQGISWQHDYRWGNANHAGTTPTRLRHDAGWVATAVSTFLRDLAVAAGTTLATIDMLRIEPNVINVIPRRALDCGPARSGRTSSAERQAAPGGIAAGGCGNKGREDNGRTSGPVSSRSDSMPHWQMRSKLRRSLGFTHRRMTSGAGHDARMIARIAPAAMIFVPSRGGISHYPREHDQLIDGANVLLDVVLRRLAEK
ncbi:M20/M25/M40 family metallo-hydrolase [Paraburkholderia youngii]|uniref:M20/M25/M40 family metallo-hydrolase n=1 Tax=Paraburkholderia youngii TaxID=2782701 RepID=UPI0015929EF6|nr:M20/M25/M40 family metallo-hydrolase [Paraburkholderia youngii]NUX59098.1 M20/M25/M40 family metallo-hydrolase [Paraburkholderia youngii]